MMLVLIWFAVESEILKIEGHFSSLSRISSASVGGEMFFRLGAGREFSIFFSYLRI